MPVSKQSIYGIISFQKALIKIYFSQMFTVLTVINDVQQYFTVYRILSVLKEAENDRGQKNSSVLPRMRR